MYLSTTTKIQGIDSQIDTKMMIFDLWYVHYFEYLNSIYPEINIQTISDKKIYNIFVDKLKYSSVRLGYFYWNENYIRK